MKYDGKEAKAGRSLVEDAAAYPARADANGWDKTFSAGDNLTLGVCLAKSGDIFDCHDLEEWCY